MQQIVGMQTEFSKMVAISPLLLIDYNRFYTAAVLEHSPKYSLQPVSVHQAQQIMFSNLQLYEEELQKVVSSGQHLDIVVFPEDGLYGGNHLFHYLMILGNLNSFITWLVPSLIYAPSLGVKLTSLTERGRFHFWSTFQQSQMEVPMWIRASAPHHSKSSLCSSVRGTTTVVNSIVTQWKGSYQLQIILNSCLARKFGVVLVLNMADVQYCDRDQDTNCPSDGQYQYNTQV